MLDLAPTLKKILTKQVEPPSFSIGDSKVEMVDNVKYSAVPINEHLAWNEHTYFVRSNVSRTIGFLKYAKKLLPQDTLCNGIVVSSNHNSATAVQSGGYVGGGTKLQVLQIFKNVKLDFDHSSYDP